MNKSNLYRYAALIAFMLSYTVLMAVVGTHGDRLKGLVQEPRGTVYERMYQYLHEPREFKEIRTVIRTLSQIVQRAPIGCARSFKLQPGSDLEGRAHDCYDSLFAAIFNLYSYFHTHPAPRTPTAEYQQLVVKFFARVKEAAAVVDEYEQALSLRQPGNGSPLQGVAGPTEASHLDAFVSKLSSSANGKPLAVIKKGPSWLTVENGAYALGGLIGCYCACWALSAYIDRQVTAQLDERARGDVVERLVELELQMKTLRESTGVRRPLPPRPAPSHSLAGATIQMGEGAAPIPLAQFAAQGAAAGAAVQPHGVAPAVVASAGTGPVRTQVAAGARGNAPLVPALPLSQVSSALHATAEPITAMGPGGTPVVFTPVSEEELASREAARRRSSPGHDARIAAGAAALTQSICAPLAEAQARATATQKYLRHRRGMADSSSDDDATRRSSGNADPIAGAGAGVTVPASRRISHVSAAGTGAASSQGRPGAKDSDDD